MPDKMVVPVVAWGGTQAQQLDNNTWGMRWDMVADNKQGKLK